MKSLQEAASCARRRSGTLGSMSLTMSAGKSRQEMLSSSTPPAGKAIHVQVFAGKASCPRRRSGTLGSINITMFVGKSCQDVMYVGTPPGHIIMCVNVFGSALQLLHQCSTNAEPCTRRQEKFSMVTQPANKTVFSCPVNSTSPARGSSNNVAVCLQRKLLTS